MQVTGDDGDPAEFAKRLPDTWIAGTVDEVVEQLLALEDAGVERVMLQHLAHDDLDMVVLLGSEVLPRVGGTGR
jgi:alkanesulfonate monooxygenase SsuD/methylene tetrahydromethanopterin reductase-like flavin-dependent oxidoreductase (luciferase family)